LPLDYVDLNHRDGQIASQFLEAITITNDDKGGDPVTTAAVHLIVI